MRSYIMFSKKLKEVLRERKITSAELARKTGFSKAAVSQYINGINIPSEKRMEILAEVLEVTVEELCGFEENPPQPLLPVIPPTATTLTTKQAAALLHKNEAYVRMGLQQGRPGFEFGSAVKTSGKWSYCIYAKKFTEVTGIPLNSI